MHIAVLNLTSYCADPSSPAVQHPLLTSGIKSDNDKSFIGNLEIGPELVIYFQFLEYDSSQSQYINSILWDFMIFQFLTLNTPFISFILFIMRYKCNI